MLENNIEFVEEKTFEWLVYKEKMRLDFFLPKYNIAIECQGVQHFKPTDFSGKLTEEETYENFKILQDRDKKKKELCKLNNLKLLYYSDKKYENDVFIKLNEILDTINNA